MPPPVADLSDDESTGESIPYDTDEQMDEVKGEVKDEAKHDVKDRDEDGQGGEEGVYIVEKILSHHFQPNGTLLLRVKWQDYDDPSDETLEPEENLLEGAKDIVEDYYSRLGGRPTKPQPKKRKPTPEKTEKSEPKRRRKSRADTATETAEENQAPDWAPKSKSWENEVKNVDTIVREGDGLVAFLHWNNGKKSKVSIETCYERCPRKMLQFYEQHLDA
ncbi:hypothetical protein AOCH_002993 [Aspergillus ochraceoroseus]|uniref:Chromo domain-containing protein n=1 Tax=Aspergillus ochraceoroseus TaxID=138278 RepID=A0A0F8TZ19_9EURO|nr:hypothetical protein AOCH_002993 [Aspergillus ochraceoroseus]